MNDGPGRRPLPDRYFALPRIRRRSLQQGVGKAPGRQLKLDAANVGLSDRPNGRRFRVARAADRGGELGSHIIADALRCSFRKVPGEMIRQ